jgi:poly-beta-1,6-N-acetyl-D-glucosamine synthase
MVTLLTVIAISSLTVFVSSYVLFYGYIKYNARKPWNIQIDNSFEPNVTVLIPVHNEERNIEKKLKNIQVVDYPCEKIEVLLIDDASVDKTLEKIENTIKNGFKFKFTLIRQEVRCGKAVALNNALDKATNSIIIVSDADTTWPANILKKALPYLADPSVGAVTAQGLNEKISESWVTKGEDNYLQLTSSIRLGESKIQSTIRFEGGFCAYKRMAFSKFDSETGSDDSGTALEANQKGFRTILVPDALFYTQFPTSLQGKLKIKVRRATQLISLWVKCVKSLLYRQRSLPKRIILPEVFLFIINPIIFVFMAISTVGSIILYPLSIYSISILASILLGILFARQLMIEVVVDNLLLFYAGLCYLFGRRYVSWKRVN